MNYIFSKTLLGGLQDNELTSAIGSSVVLKFFVQEKGSELFHCIPELVSESFLVSFTKIQKLAIIFL